MATVPILPIVTVTVMEDSSVVILGRILATDREPMQQADISAITLKVVDYTTGTETHTATLAGASVIFDALQTDSRWTRDALGYNFRYTVPHTAFPSGERTYRIEAKFVLNDGAQGKVPWQVRTEKSRTAL